MEKEELKSTKYVDQVNDICDESYQAIIDLLKSLGEKCYIAFGNWEDYSLGLYMPDNLLIYIFAVGLDEEGEICIAAEPAADRDVDMFYKDWTSIQQTLSVFFPCLYEFIVDNIDKAMTKEEADKIVKAFFEERAD